MPSAPPLQWIFQFVDKVSGPAHAAEKSLGYFGKMSHEVEEAVDGLLEKFAGFELLKGAGELVEHLAEKMLDMGVEFGKSAIEAGLFEQKSAIGFEALTGSATKAKEVLEESKGFADQFAISYAESAALFKVGLLKGLKFEGPNSITQFAQIGVDLEKLGLGSARNIVEAFGDVQAKGKLTARSLLAFKDTGVDFDVLAKKLGIVVQKGQGFEALQKATEGEHRISAARGLPALLDTLGEKFGVLGGTAERSGNLIDGQVQKIKNSWEGLLGRVAESGVLDKIADTLGKIAKSMDPASESGKAWALTFDRLFSSADRFLKLFTPERLQSILDTVSKLALETELLAEALAKVVGFVAKITPAASSTALNALTGGASGAFDLGRKVLGFADGGRVTSPTLALIGEGGEPENIIPDSKMPRGGTQLHLEQHFHVSDHAGLDTKELAHLMHELSLGDLQGAMDTLAQQMGN